MYLHDAVEELNLGIQRTNPKSGREEDLSQELPNPNALNHSDTQAL